VGNKSNFMHNTFLLGLGGNIFSAQVSLTAFGALESRLIFPPNSDEKNENQGRERKSRK